MFISINMMNRITVIIMIMIILIIIIIITNISIISGGNSVADKWGHHYIMGPLQK